MTILLIASALARGDQGWEGQIVSLTLENDAVASADRHYTQGAFLSYLSADDALARWTRALSDSLPAVGFELEARKWGIGVGQEIYTPENLQSAELLVDDRPYAGWLFARFTLQRRGLVSRRWSALENIHLDLGVIGPEAYAEETQKEWHGEDPRGWDHQLQTEPGMVLRYERRYRFRAWGEPDGWGLQLIPHGGGSAGNVATLLHAGGVARFGYNIPDEFVTAAGPRTYKYGAYLMLGTDGRLVFHNIFLDGNTWTSSHRVDKRPFVADFKAGFAVILGRFEISFTQVYRTREFNDQNSADTFGSGTLSVKF
ncbi:MAG: lipid A deacylase LpxR family protein [Verrucomicrobia subdivision 3 bacterium]|nr:lipid A deacylase LpxR family protein [Limisphaerales bacterium]